MQIEQKRGKFKLVSVRILVWITKMKVLGTESTDPNFYGIL